ncbi:MAG: hypothetical protein JXB50_08340 [Spirochaetes bacterium]|nr:hypothetical protein [Spirochaetota bacterium]
MTNENLMLILYPIIKVRLKNNQKSIIKEILKISEDQLDEIFKSDNLKDYKLEKNRIKIKSKKETIEIFLNAKKIVENVDFSIKSIERLIDLGKILEIDKNETGFDFDIYDSENINHFEFIRSVRNFSLIAAAVGFLPIVPISDYTLLVLIQLGLLSKIANIYNFKLDVKGFLKMIFTTLGTGLILKTFSKILYSFIPVLGWGINAAVAYAGTYAIGILAKRYIEEEGEMTAEKIKSIWKKSFDDGKKEFLSLKNIILKKKDDLIKEIYKFKNKNYDKKENIKEEFDEDDDKDKSVDVKVKKKKKNDKD